MTAQIPDSFVFEGEDYSLIGMEGGELASPDQFGMESERMSTACYRGFYATYELTSEALFLRELTVLDKNRHYPTIDGVEAEAVDGETTYLRLSVVVPFTGRIRLAKDFIEKFYIHMGFQKASAFKTVLDIALREGRVVAIKDRSNEMETRRGAFKKRYESESIIQRVDEAFSLDMSLE